MVNKQIKWREDSAPPIEFQEEMIGVYSCYSHSNKHGGSETVFIFIRSGILWKKTIDVFETKWYIGNIT